MTKVRIELPSTWKNVKSTLKMYTADGKYARPQSLSLSSADVVQFYVDPSFFFDWISVEADGEARRTYDTGYERGELTGVKFIDDALFRVVGAELRPISGVSPPDLYEIASGTCTGEAATKLLADKACYDCLKLRKADHPDSIFRAEDYVRTYKEARNKWETSSEFTIYSTEPPALPPAPPVPPFETPLQSEWREFFEHPDVVKAFELTPSSIQESFSLVFSNYSIINARPQSPETGDYASVFLILAGLTALAATAIYAVLAAMPHVGVGGMMKGSAGMTSRLSASALKHAGSELIKAAGVGKLGALATRVTTSPWFALITVAGIYWINIWNLTDPMWWWGVEVKMTGDTKKRFESLRIDVNKKLQQSYALVYIDTDAAKLASARTLLRATKPLITEMFNLLMGLEIDKPIKEIYPEFEESVKSSVSQYNDLVTAAGGTADDYLAIEGLMAPPPELPVTYPKEFVLEDVQVVDGDSIKFPGHPEVKNEIRIIGIDAHEAETAAGIEETAYLKSLIEFRTVTIKTHEYGDPERTIGYYGRLLGGVFLGDQDIALAMLEHFGNPMKNTKFWGKKYRWIDWDEYKRVAEAAKGPAVKEFKIYIDSTPSNAKLYIDGKYTHHLTPSDETELKDVMDMLAPGEHVIMASKAGLEGSVLVNIVEGVNPDILLILQVKGLEPVEPEPVEPPVEPPAEVFKISVLSTPSRARLFIDGEYTHHLTPSNETELSDVLHLLVPGEHTFRAEKGGKAAEKVVVLTSGTNPPIYLALEVVGLPVSREDLEKEISSLDARIAELRAQLEKL